MTIQEKSHRKVFFAAFPKRPWLCAHCKVKIWTKQDVAVHHKNKIRKDNRLRNLVPMHHGCHSAHHRLTQEKRTRSLAQRQQASHAMRKRWQDPEYRAAHAAGMKRAGPKMVRSRQNIGRA